MMHKMMSKIIVLMVLLVSVMVRSGIAAPYQPVNIKEIVDYGKKLDAETKQESYFVTVNEQKLAALVQQLEQSAGSYPTKFDTPKDQAIATEQVTQLVNLLDVVATERSTGRFLDLVWRLNNIAYNLDIKDSATRVEKITALVFARWPDDIRMHYLIGNFKAGQGNLDVGIEHLTKAVNANYAPAFFSLGLAYTMKGNHEKSVVLLEKYQKLVPEDPRTTTLLEGIKSGTSKVMSAPAKIEK